MVARGPPMPDEVLLKADTIEITTKVARFGDIAYQVANIGSIAIYTTRKFNPVALAMFALSVVLAIAAYDLNSKAADNVGVLSVAALALGVGGVVIQLIWPKLISTLVLKTSSNDVHKLETTDVAHANLVRNAVEEAFVRRSS
jgi:Family of unknown function (DUF6232)